MPIKNLLHRFQPAPLFIVLILSICYFSVQLILSHLTHALTLLMASYHMLCNIFALAGSILTIKHNEIHNENEKMYSEQHLKLTPSIVDNENKQIVAVAVGKQSTTAATVVQVAEEEARLTERKRREMKTRNTFGWARIEILTMLIVCITLASLSFSLLVEALQTLVHIDHQDSMHLPVHVMILGFVGLLLNGFTYLLIGGYTLHQGNSLHLNPMGKVVVEHVNVTLEENVLPKGMTNSNNVANHQLKEDLKAEGTKVHYRTRREGPAEFLRDVSSTIFVIVCAIIVYFAKDKEHTAKFIDPVLSIFSCVLVVGLSYPYMKESCLILLQTIPGGIDMDNFERTLVTKFPQIVSYHDLHIWQLSSHKYVATVHIIFENPKLFAKTIEDIRAHFHEYSIAHVTIQPEFQTQAAALTAGTSPSTECLMQCQNPDCLDKVCCKDSMTDLREISVCSGGGGGGGGGGEENGKKLKKQQHNHHHGHSHGHGGHGHGHGHNHKQEHKYKHNGHKHGKGHKCAGEETEMETTVSEPHSLEGIVEKQETDAVVETRKTQVPAECIKQNGNEEKASIESKAKVSEENQTIVAVANSPATTSVEEKTDSMPSNATMATTTNTNRDDEESISDSNTKC